MTWWQSVAAFLKSARVISTAGGVTGTGVYVSYADWTRYRRMMTKYTTGNILPPMAENKGETVYFPRPKLDQVPILPAYFEFLVFFFHSRFGSGHGLRGMTLSGL